MIDSIDKSPLTAIGEFLKLESAAGLLLVIAGVLAMIAANSPAAGLYGALLDVPFGVHLGGFRLDKPLLLWINDRGGVSRDCRKASTCGRSTASPCSAESASP